MKRGTLIEHKETAIVYEENGLVSLSYNVLLTTLKAITIVKPTHYNKRCPCMPSDFIGF
jgi:hypothetical protein